jgi:hypothetical protein
MATRTPFNRVPDPLMSPAPTATPPNFNAIIDNAIPGFGGMSTGASNIVNQLIQGMPSAAPTQRANAYFGAASGMPGSDFVRNRGFDLYGQEAEASKQRGFDNFLKMIGAFSGTVAPTTGQSLQASQAAADLASRNRQADAQLGLERDQMAWNQSRLSPKTQGTFRMAGQPTAGFGTAGRPLSRWSF